MQTVDVTCPAGSAEDDVIQVTFGDTEYTITVPPGISEGMTFSVELPEQEQAEQELPALGAANSVASALQTVLDALEDNDDSRLDELVDGHCEQFAEYEPGSEAQLEWTGLHEAYVAECEGFIGEVLGSLDCTAEDVFADAQAYSGSDQRVQRLIGKLLAMADFEAFCKMMRSRHEVLGLFD